MEQHTHATSSGEVGKTVKPSQKTSTMVHQASYDEVHSSMTDQFADTYSSRAKSLEDKLGNKDSVKG